MSSRQTSIIVNRDEWVLFSPRRAYSEATTLLADNRATLSHNSIQLLEEVQVTATFTLGVVATDGAERWLRCPGQREATPDVYVSYLQPATGGKDQILVEHEMEVVGYDKRTDIELAEFLRAKKLTHHKAYAKGATILCHIDAPTSLPSWHDLHLSLRNDLNGLQLAFVARVVRDFPGFVSVLMTGDKLLVGQEFSIYEELAKPAKDILNLKRASGSGLTPRVVPYVPMFSLPKTPS